MKIVQHDLGVVCRLSPVVPDLLRVLDAAQFKVGGWPIWQVANPQPCGFFSVLINHNYVRVVALNGAFDDFFQIHPLQRAHETLTLDEKTLLIIKRFSKVVPALSMPRFSRHTDGCKQTSPVLAKKKHYF